MISGDLSQMGQLAARLRDLANVPSRTSAKISERISELLQQEFDAGADAYGNTWQALAPATVERGRTPPPLTDTHAMRDGVRVAPMAHAGVAITIPHPGGPHQTGWSGPQGSGPARPMLPTNRMPTRWREVVEMAARESVRAVLR